MTCDFRSFLLFSGTCTLLCIMGCNSSPPDSDRSPPAPSGNVVRFEVIDEDIFRNRIRTLVSGKATTENQEFLNGLRDSALKTFPDGGWMIFGPEATLRTIRLVCERGEIQLSSWHPNDDGAVDDVAKRDKFDEIERLLISRFKSP